MGKKTKDHRQKVAKRNSDINQNKKSAAKMQEEYIMRIIEQERLNGNFDTVEQIQDSTITVIDLDKSPI